MSVTEIYKNVPALVTITFKREGSPIAFAGNVKFNVFNSEDTRLLNGIATSIGNGQWQASFTIPDNYELSNNQDTEDLLVELYGVDTDNKTRSREVYVVLVDSSDDFIPEGIIGFVKSKTPTYDYLFMDSLLTDTTFDVTITNQAGLDYTSDRATIVSYKKVRAATDTPDRFEGPRGNTGYIYKIELPSIEDLPESTAPYHVTYEINNETIVHSLYWADRRTISAVNSLRQLLDKARLVEIDPTLQWYNEELVAALYEGLSYINAYPNDLTYWKFSDLPQSLEIYWRYAGAFHALNSRYLAEGMNSFEFNGLSSSLNYDRRETLTYKMEEFKGFLSENLKNAKSSAIKSNGIGSLDATLGIKQGSGNRVGLLHLTSNPSNNIRGRRSSLGLKTSRMFNR